ncbi:MAG: BON domain-containing protein [Proteobacteria bacterium]|nr:BON domain-containing protein [Pseudomonadota bacterium]
MTHRIRLPLLAAALAASVLITACAPILVGGAVAGGAISYNDRRTTGTQVDDQGIVLRTGSRIQEALGGRGHVNVNSMNRLVLLTGEVDTEADKQTAETVARGVDTVRSVVNELAVTLPSSVSARSQDTLTTTQVKARLIDATDIQANVVKVVTERGEVYLMGIVSEREATRAAEVAAGTKGVRKVVRVFEVVSDADLAR